MSDLDPTERIETYQASLDRISEWIRTADQKAAFNLTIVLALLGASMLVVETATKVFLRLIGIGYCNILIAVAYSILFVLYVVVSSFAIWSLFRVVMPRTDPKSDTGSLFFFQSISEMSLPEFAESLASLDMSEIRSDLAGQIHEVSLVAAEKYKHVANSFRRTIAASVLALIFIGSTSILSAILFSGASSS